MAHTLSIAVVVIVIQIPVKLHLDGVALAIVVSLNKL
jgi:hypothetical protein